MQEEQEFERGYILKGKGYLGFFPKKTFDQVFAEPTDLHKDWRVTFRSNSPHENRKDSFLCNHELYHAKSIWDPYQGTLRDPRSQFICLGTYGLNVDEFLNGKE